MNEAEQIRNAYEESKAQLNLSIPQWQLDELEKRAKKRGVKRTVLAHRIIAEWLERTIL
jgi:hypothetical protein